MAALAEADLIAVVAAACAVPPPPAGPGDDAAVIAAPREGRQVITTDALVEDVHFLRDHPAEALGWKALMVNLSDVAAMGAVPAAFVLSAALPRDLPATWWAAFSRGLAACARHAGVALVGGDTVASPGPLLLNVTAWGWTRGDAVLTRSGGRPGDVVLVRGEVGRSALGLARWRARPRGGWRVAPLDDDADPCLAAHLRPIAPLDAGPWALGAGATAGMDLSDGLLVDLGRLAVASGVALDVDLGQLPPDPELVGVAPDARAAGGEDYGLVVLAPPDRVGAFTARGFSAIGVAREASGAQGPHVVWRLHGEPARLGARPFEHFG